MFSIALPWPAPTSLAGFSLGIISLYSTHIVFLNFIEFFSFYTFIFLPVTFILLLILFIRVVLPRVVEYLSFYANRGYEHDPGGYCKNFTLAFCLGGVLVLGFILSSHAFRSLPNPRIIWPFATYLILLSFFHWSEFFVAALTSPSRTDVDLYLIDHSPEYHGAMALSFLEYWLEVYFWRAKCTSFLWLNLFGFAIAVSGEALRKIAMLTAADNFNHYVEHTHRQGHRLIRSGVYAWCRHPAYAGWFFWSIGTQILLVNPLCSVIYPVVAYFFFKSRVYSEERSLLLFFGDAYRKYQREVPTGLPFIRGYVESSRSGTN